MYSSKTVLGKPLFEYARDGLVVKIPTSKIVVKKIILQKIRKVKPEILLPKIEKRISKVVGDFRQKEIIQKWRRVLGTKKAKGELFLVDFVINCSSGTYVRKIAHDLGERLKVGGLAFEIYRTRVGRYRI
jgi:tRNA U55 pseudouridine synthase TruB